RPGRVFAGQGVDLVGVAGFEPTAFRSQSGRAAKLRHTPVTPMKSTCTLGAAPRGVAAARGCSSMVELQPSKLAVRVRFPSPAPTTKPQLTPMITGDGRAGHHSPAIGRVPLALDASVPVRYAAR